MNTKTFAVAARSTNTNRFGLRGFVFVADDGEAWEAASGFNDHREGDRVSVPVVNGEADFVGYECQRPLTKAPPDVVQAVWNRRQFTEA
jgi:hypothetical protein